jgi:DNA polymerase-3 subunit alpha
MDVATILALIRPGVMGSDQYGIYLKRRKRLEETRYLLPEMKSFLSETYGVCIFQEDLMRMAQVYAGYSLVEAENLRRGIGKKELEKMKKIVIDFEEKSARLGRNMNDTQQMLQQLEAAARYSFNKSHAVGYAYVTYACAYLSTHYPLQFFKHLLALADEKEKSSYLSDAMTRGIKLLPPDVNRSERVLTIDGNALRMGLLSMKGVGEVAVQKIIEGRPYKNVSQVAAKVNRAIYAILYVVGAMSELEGNDSVNLIAKPEEADVLGIRLSGMTSDMQQIYDKIKAVPISTVKAEPATIIAKITGIKEHIAKNGKMAFLTLVDMNGPKCEGVMFANAFKVRTPVQGETYSMVVTKTGRGSLSIDSIIPIDEVRDAVGV